MDSVQENAILRCGHLECCDIGTCEMQARAEGLGTISTNVQQEGVQPNSVTFMGVLNACANLIALEEGRCVHHWIIQNGFGVRCLCVG